MTNPFLNSVLKNSLWAVGILIALAFAYYGSFFKKSDAPSYEIYSVQKSNITQAIYVTGRIKTPETFNLAFEKPGKINRVLVKIGESVYPGKALIELDSSDLMAQLQQEEANLEAQKVKLKELEKGSRPEEIALAEAKLQNAQDALNQAQKNFNDELLKSYVVSDDALKSRADGMFLNPTGANPQLKENINDSQLKYLIETQRKDIQIILTNWGSDVYNDEKARENLNEMRKFFDNLALVANQLAPGGSLTQTIIDGYKTNISSARAAINSAVSSLNAAKEKAQNSLFVLEVARKELELKKAGATKEQIEAQEAVIKQAQAKVSLIKTQINKNILRSPISGIVSKLEARLGEIAAAYENLISILPHQPLQIETNIPEIDVGKIEIGNSVKITIDAYPGEAFEGVVSYIEPAETIIDGVVNYKAIVSFQKLPPKIKSGLTANLSIEILRKNGVLAIPSSAYIEKDNGIYVKKLVNGQLEEIKIQIGIKSQDGLTEVISGLKEGDQIINIGLK